MNRRNFFSVLSKAVVTAISIPFLPKSNITPPLVTSLIGHTSDDFMKAGFVYAPYIPMYTTNTLMCKEGTFNI